ncbi:Histone-arginine methyltransferase CARMER [Trachymyrmex cornetzi]|uniref:type I protein arginine methyltransferase n=1 Tax=Trachymyrmex cornetzi TaxID=471704 RepID=A0A195EHH5_9HYME|nr:Histone-arginine methyltransferase CARMER [Trachymyrmex cornetzi]
MAKTFRVTVSTLSNNGQSTPKYNKPVALNINYDPQGLSVELVSDVSNREKATLLEFPVTPSTECSRVSSRSYVFTLDTDSLLITFASEPDFRDFHSHIVKLKMGKGVSAFNERTEESSAMQYFQFYGYLSQQQNMMQDYIRTSTYQRAILGNLSDFKDKVVLDVGAGSGILSFFAIQAGAKKVYAVEASNMANHAELLVAANNLQDKIIVIAGKIEEIDLPEHVDCIVSEPMGYMLYNERMLETYLHAKKWLSPGGRMFPSRGDLHIAPFSDENLYMEQFNKANFWYQTCFHGVDLSAMRNNAIKEYFRQPIVDTFDIRICMAKSVRHIVDFQTADETDLHKIEINVDFHILESGTCHGLAFWFDVAFIGSTQQVWLSTAPTEPLTHWYQVRCLLENPLFCKSGQLLSGKVILIANKRQSYDVTIELKLEGTNLESSNNTLDLKNPYFRYTGAAAQPPPGLNNTSPSESYWTTLDAQGARQAVNMVNGMSVNGLGEVSMDTSATVNPNNLLAIGGQPNIHPGSISSTGRGRVGGTATSTQAAQLIGGGITPNMFTSPATRRKLKQYVCLRDFRATAWCYFPAIAGPRQHFSLPSESQPDDRSSIGDIGNNSKQGRKLVFSSPTSKLRLSSAVRILSTVDLANFNSDFSHNNVAYSNKSTANPEFAFDWNPVRNKSQLEARWKRLRAVLS